MAPLDSSAHAHLVLRKCKFCAKGGEKPLSSLPTSSPPENQPKEKKIRFPLWFLTTTPPPALPSRDTPPRGKHTHKEYQPGLAPAGKGQKGSILTTTSAQQHPFTSYLSTKRNIRTAPQKESILVSLHLREGHIQLHDHTAIPGSAPGIGRAAHREPRRQLSF